MNNLIRFIALSIAFSVATRATGLIAASPDKPNILFIVADDLRADLTSAYGGPVKTPNLDKLAERGCLFTRATCGYPICHVSRTEMITGRSLVAEASKGGAIAFKPDWALWPEVMRQAGWHTVYSGKWHVQGTPWTRGYAETSGLYSSGGAKNMPLTFPESATGRKVTGYSGWTFKTNDRQALPELGVGLTPDTDKCIADGAIDAIGAHADKPLFLHVNFTAPHDPLHWPKGKENTYKPGDIALPANFLPQHPFEHGNITGRDEVIVPAPRTGAEVKQEHAVYYALLENLDAQIGRVVQALEDRGILSRTLIIFTSDHGLALGSHGLMGKQNQYEHTANVPLILSGPGIPEKRRITAQCALRDLFPTVCDISALPIPGSVQGRSLLPLLKGEKEAVHDHIFGYFSGTQRMIRANDGWKLIWYPKAGRTQLFNVADDPQELQDLSADPTHQARAKQMMQSLKEWLRDHRDTLDEAAAAR
jgi:arylsulfatase A-like enzyme